MYLLLVAVVAASSCASSAPPARHALVDVDYPAPFITAQGTERGVASWYGPGFHGQSTASGERYDQHAMTAAHRTLPLGVWIEVRNLRNDRRVRVRVNDRGPYKFGRVLDLSRAAAQSLGVLGPGTAEVDIRLLDPRFRAWPSVRYSVQIGAYRGRAEADAAGVKAAHAGESAYLKLTRNAEFPWSVRIGPFPARRDALAARDRLAAQGLDGLLVEEDPPRAVYADAPTAARALPGRFVD
jgi:rare lipoprotein A